MAIPIKDTPVLLGKDAEKFSKEIAENSTKAISKEEFERMKSNYLIFKSLEKNSSKR